ncbi:MAG TPA: BRCT domain-containing protein, partial [Gemmataceae bacterium]|nr:BRCT domain-containing protein [Gemmataceae bacterium]
DRVPLDFWKALAFHPAWEADPWLTEFRRSDLPWARALEFDEGLSGRVLGWLGDVRRFAPADLGFDWLMRLVDRSEPRYHDFAVEVMTKALRPADFAPHQPEAQARESATVNLGGASFLFTGKMATMPRKDAEDKVKQLGGVKASSVTKSLHYLVIGDEGSPLYSGGKKGDKQTKAEQLNAAGANIRIISETAFLQLLAGTARAAAAADATLAGCEVLWRMAVAPGPAEARRGEFARKYILRHHPEIGPAQTDRPVDPGAEIPPEFLTFARVEPLFAETRKPLRDFALELARYEFARWKPPAEALLALSELPHADVRKFVAEALLADDDPEKRRYRIDPDTLAPEAVYRFCESSDPETRKLGMQIIRRSPRLQVPEEMFRLTESPDRLVRGFVIRSLWAVYRARGVTADWRPPVPPASTIGPAARKAASEPESRGPGVPHRPEKPPGDRQSLAEFLRRVLFEVPPGPPPKSADAPEAAQKLKPLPARKAKLELVEVMRDLALEDAEFAAGVLPLLEEFMTSRGQSEKAACLVAVTRIRHRHPSGTTR